MKVVFRQAAAVRRGTVNTLRARVPSLVAGVLAVCAAVSLAGTPPALSPLPLDGTPKVWSEMKIDWKPTWDETLAANGNEATLKQELDRNPDLQKAADRIARLRRIGLLEALIARFPAEKDKHVAACRAVAETYMSLGDRTRAAQWLKKLVEDFPGRPEAADACAGILQCADPFDAMPFAREWVTYALQQTAAMVKAGVLAKDHPAVALATQRAYALLLHERRYEDAGSLLDRLEAAEDRPEWRIERADLLAAVGHLRQAAAVYDANGITPKTSLAKMKEGSIDRIGKRLPVELELRWQQLLGKKKYGRPLLEDPGLVLETVKFSAETGAMWEMDATHRVLCWLEADRMLKDSNPADLAPLRELEERSAVGLAERLDSTAPSDEVERLFQRYPWSDSVLNRLLMSGEMLLREDRPGEALRAFEEAAAHSADPATVAQARVGSWLAMVGTPEAWDVVEDAMAAVQDDVLEWRGKRMPAAEVKRAIRALLPPDAKPLPSLSALRRAKLRLPSALAMADPFPRSEYSVPQGLGPWAVRRIDVADDLLLVTGPRHVACYDAATLLLRWVKAADPSQDSQAAQFSAVDRSRAVGAWQHVTLGTGRSAAVAPQRAPQTGAKIGAKALYGLMFHDMRDGLAYDVTAVDVLDGRVLWRTLDRQEWRGLEPLCDPAAADGRVYVVAYGGNEGNLDPSSAVYLVCLDGENGNMLWKQRLGNPSGGDELRELALRGSAVTVRQGAVYVSSNLGLLSRCNARDGAIEWVRTYPSAIRREGRQDQFRREGTSPVVAGGQVFVAPRDHSGVMAFDCDTGHLLWEALLVPSEQILGASGSILVVRDGNTIAGLDTASGKRLWTLAVDESAGARSLVAGPDVVVVSRGMLRRVSAATGVVSDEERLAGGPGTEHVLLRNGTLVEMSQEPAPSPAAKMQGATRPPQAPLETDWTLPCDKPLLAVSPAERGPANMFGILSGRSFLCVKTQPRCEIAWRAVLKNGADSIGFHGSLVVVARGRTLTALDAANGGMRWSLDLPFDVHVVGGDKRIIFAGELSKDAKVAAIDPATGTVRWSRWFGKEAVCGDGPLAWISMRHDPADPAALILYWKSALFGKEGWRPGEMVVDAASGIAQPIRPFLPDEPQWPARIAFGDSTRTYVRQQPSSPRTCRGSFRMDAVAYIGKDSVARFLLSGQGTDMAPGSIRKADLGLESRYAGAIELCATAGGSYLKQMDEILFFDATTKTGIVSKLPREAGGKAACTLLELCEGADTFTALSAEPPPPPGVDPRLYTHGGLKDDTGAGDVTIRFFEGRGAAAQVYMTALRGIPEAGANPVASLLDGQAVEAYYGQKLSMSGIDSLGWAKYDIFLYGGIPWAVINGQDRQTCTGWDLNNPTHRTTFIQGVNYLKFAGVTGDVFTIEYAMSGMSGIQIVDASAGTGPGRKAASLGIAWNGGTGGPGPNDRVGAEVPGGCWYVIGPEQPNHYYSRTHIAGGYRNPFIFVDVFDRNTGDCRRTQKVPVSSGHDRVSGYNCLATRLGDAMVVTDAQNVYVLRTGADTP